MSDFLFNRREAFKATGAAVAGLALGGSATAADAVTIGEGKWKYTLDPTWGTLPTGMKYGLGCALVTDGQDRIYVTSRSADPCVAIFDKAGKLVETWTNDFTDRVGFNPKQYVATAHGLYWSKESVGEFLYWTENVAGKAPDKIGARVYKTDLAGKVLYTLGPGVKASSTSAPFTFTNPTDVAVSANGDIYIVDGYGSQLVYHFDKNFKHLKTIGGKGKEHGKFNTCHGVWINTLRPEPEVYIADRANGRLEVYSLALDYKRTLEGFRAPCCFYQHDGHLYVPELNARVSILDANDKVVAHLGDGKDVPKENAGKVADKFATPHALTLDSKGNLYVIEWLDFGRPRKFLKT